MSDPDVGSGEPGEAGGALEMPFSAALPVWLALAVPMWLAFHEGVSLPWGIVVGGPWAGALVLLLLIDEGDAADLAGELAGSSVLRTAGAVHLLLLFLSGSLFGPPFVALLVAWAGFVFLLLVKLDRAALLRGAIVGLSVSGAVLVVLLGGLEALFRSPAIADRLGGPAKEARWWDERYEGLWEENIFEFQSPSEFRFRSPYETVRKPEGVRRILALGDSFTWGDKIPEADDVWPGELEKRLRDRPGDVRHQVINMGQGGLTTANEAELLRRVGWQFDPDVVLLQFYINDAYPSGPGLERTGACRAFGCVKLLPERFRSGPVDRSSLLSFLEQRLTMLLHPVDYSSLYRRDAVGWRQLRDALIEVGEASRTRGVPVVLVIFPAFAGSDWGSTGHPHSGVHEKVSREARRAGLGVLDLTPAFAGRDRAPREWWATPWDQHPSEEAHELAAAAILDYLEERGLVSPRAG